MCLQYIVRAFISLISLFLIAKAIGSRQISEMSLFDYINGITIGSIAAEIVFAEEKVWELLLVLLFFGLAAIFISWLSDKSLFMRRLIEGKPQVLFQNGNFLYKNMKKCKIDLSEFLMLCREQGYFDLSEVWCAVLESNGKMSILPKSEHRPLTPADVKQQPSSANLFANIIMEGNIMHSNLKSIGKDEKWLKKQMRLQHISDEKEIFLAVCDGNGKCYFFFKKNISVLQDKLM